MDVCCEQAIRETTAVNAEPRPERCHWSVSIWIALRPIRATIKVMLSEKGSDGPTGFGLLPHVQVSYLSTFLKIASWRSVDIFFNCNRVNLTDN